MTGFTAAGEEYNRPIAFIYIFNLIIGVGALSLPLGFNSSGLV